MLKNTNDKIKEVRTGALIVTNEEDATLVSSSPGSGLIVVVNDTSTGVAGMLHTMLPDSRISPAKSARLPGLFVDTGVELLLKTFFKSGGGTKEFSIKVVGGADPFCQVGEFDLGRQNLQMLLKTLAMRQLQLANKLTGVSVASCRVCVTTGSMEANLAQGGKIIL